MSSLVTFLAYFHCTGTYQNKKGNKWSGKFLETKKKFNYKKNKRKFILSNMYFYKNAWTVIDAGIRTPPVSCTVDHQRYMYVSNVCTGTRVHVPVPGTGVHIEGTFIRLIINKYFNMYV